MDFETIKNNAINACAAVLVLGFLFKYGIRFEKDAVRM